MACQDRALRSGSNGTSGRHPYRAHGLAILSDIALDQLPHGDEDAPPDLRIRFGNVPPENESRPGYRCWQVRDQFRYVVRDGRDIVIEPLAGASKRNVADAVMSRLITAAIYQRGALPLHASAVDIDGHLVAICGGSGAGKSTFAAALARQGGQIVADDILVLGDEGDAQGVWPGARGLKLSEASLVHVGRSSQGLDLANEVEGKYFLPLPPRDFGRRRLSRLLWLREGPVGVTPLAGAQAAAIWRNCIRMADLMHVAPHQAGLWRRWLGLVAGATVATISHGRRMSALDELARALAADYLPGNNTRSEHDAS